MRVDRQRFLLSIFLCIIFYFILYYIPVYILYILIKGYRYIDIILSRKIYYMYNVFLFHIVHTTCRKSLLFIELIDFS